MELMKKIKIFTPIQFISYKFLAFKKNYKIMQLKENSKECVVLLKMEDLLEIVKISL